MAWWSSLPPFSTRNVLLLQVDLVGHSVWMEKAQTDIETAEARTELAVLLKNALATTRFDRLSWLGDGGLFTREYSDYEDAESVCRAADEIFRIFHAWRQPHWKIQLRVSATLALAVFVHPDEPGYWCSQRLNAFVKYERAIGLQDAFVITDDLRRALKPHTPCSARFTVSRQINIGGSEQITIWLDDHHPDTLREDPLRFLQWLEPRLTQSPFAMWRLPLRPDPPPHALWFGDACIFSAALQSNGYRAIEFTLIPNTDCSSIIREGDQEVWLTHRSLNIKNQVTGTKLSIVRLRGELKDDPIVRLQYRLTPYEDIKAFEAMIEEDAIRRTYYWSLLLHVLLDGTPIPTTLSNHVLVILGRPEYGRQILLAHRRKGRRPGGFSDNCWSVSFEEQFNPVKVSIGDRDILQDRGIADCAIRGIREEFVGDRYVGTTQVSVHAFVVEGSILNFAVLSILELPDATIEDVRRWWSTPGVAVDAEEHDAVMGIPLERSTLMECLGSAMLPEKLWPREVKGLAEVDQRWHPTGPLRLALAMWFAESPQS